MNEAPRVIKFPGGLGKRSGQAISMHATGDSQPAPPKRAPGRAHGKHKAHKMNDLEQRYADHLTGLTLAGEVSWWSFESITFILAPRCTYTADFLVMLADGAIEIHETKGHMEDDAAAKLRMVSAQFPFPVYVIKEEPGEWLKKPW